MRESHNYRLIVVSIHSPPLREEKPPCDFFHTKKVCFNPLPSSPRGETLAFKIIVRGFWFQSTPLLSERRNNVRRLSDYLKFVSIHSPPLREEKRSDGTRTFLVVQVSIHSPPLREEKPIAKRSHSYNRFVSIHSPPLREEKPFICHDWFSYQGVSIHSPPLREEKPRLLRSEGGVRVSIHSPPLREEKRLINMLIHQRKLFQSTPLLSERRNRPASPSRTL